MESQDDFVWAIGVVADGMLRTYDGRKVFCSFLVFSSGVDRDRVVGDALFIIGRGFPIGRAEVAFVLVARFIGV